MVAWRGGLRHEGRIIANNNTRHRTTSSFVMSLREFWFNERHPDNQTNEIVDKTTAELPSRALNVPPAFPSAPRCAPTPSLSPPTPKVAVFVPPSPVFTWLRTHSFHRLMKDKTVAWAGLYKARPGSSRLDFGPFLVTYVVLLAVAVAPFTIVEDRNESVTTSSTSERSIPLWILVAWPFVLIAHLLTHLSTHWSVACNAAVSYTQVSTAQEATHVRVRPPRNSGVEEIVPLERVSHENEEDGGDAAVLLPKDTAARSITVVGEDHRLPYARFTFQKTVFCYWKPAARRTDFERLSYPTCGLVQHFHARTGYIQEQEVAMAGRLWGNNVFDIPLPPFLELFKEHAVAPFFVFQVLCVLLWSLDEYWYYSLFTLVLLVVFESTVCYQRQRSLEELRSMRRPPYRVWVHREGRWTCISTEALLPGDLVSLGRMNAHPAAGAEEEEEKALRSRAKGSFLAKFKGKGGGSNRRAGHQAHPPPPVNAERGQGEEAPPSERLVPCDLLLLRGSCIVNEAMLTGESTPQLKECLEMEGSEGRREKGGVEGGGGPEEDLVPPPFFSLGAGVSANAHVRSHVVFGGTKVLQLGEKKQAQGEGKKSGGSKSNVGGPPDQAGALGFVLRTGFETSQGQLMRTILFATRRVTAGSSETAVFIGILLLFAVAAAGVVLRDGLKDEGRNRFKLGLHCIMIITSVVPPELPMELSLAVTNSLAALSKALVFCTEPFRIPYAGKVSTCCFDKTGTLTSDDLVLRGLVSLGGRQEASSEKNGSQGRASPGAREEEAAEERVLPPTEVAGPALWVLVACHSLMTVEGRVAGDPMECAAVEGLGWMVSGEGNIVLPNPASPVMLQRRGPEAPRQERDKAALEDMQPIRLHHRYPFSSSLRRMSVLASRPAPSPSPQHSRQLLILTKGAPEAIRPFLSAVPSNYTSSYLYHMGRGRRVLALAYRVLGPGTDYNAARQLSREEAEKDLTFAGLLIVDCPLKKETASVMEALQASRHRTVMITGDSALTAAEVARQVGMVPHGPKETLLLGSRLAGKEGGKEGGRGGNGGLGWETMADVVGRRGQTDEGGKGECRERNGEKGGSFIPFSVEGLGDLAARFSLCVGGEALAELLAIEVGPAVPSNARGIVEDEADGDEGARVGGKTASGRTGSMSRETLRWLAKLCPHVVVFARVAPEQKEMLIAALNEAGQVTLMCGDGTNDVGALKQAHVGVSIINSPELEKRAEVTSAKYQAKLAAMGTGAEGRASRAQVQAAAGVGGKGASEEEISRMAQILAELREQDKDPGIVQLGDASIASPFTAKRTSIDCVLAIIRQGRCTLVTTLQVYKILALNCLVSAYMLSSLYLFGVKQGDLQMTALGLVVAAMFFFVSRAEPLERLSAERPPSRIFCAQVCVSIVLQFLVHLGCLMDVLERAKPLLTLTSKDPSIAPDGPFRPNLVNTAIFLLSAITQVNTFTANYRGHPFMQSLSENKALGRLSAGLYALLFLLTLEIVPSFNRWLQLVQLPGPFRQHLMYLLLFDTGAVWMIEQFCLRLLPI